MSEIQKQTTSYQRTREYLENLISNAFKNDSKAVGELMAIQTKLSIDKARRIGKYKFFNVKTALLRLVIWFICFKIHE